MTGMDKRVHRPLKFDPQRCSDIINSPTPLRKSHSATHKIPQLLWSPKAQYNISNSPTLFPEPYASSPHLPTLFL